MTESDWREEETPHDSATAFAVEMIDAVPPAPASTSEFPVPRPPRWRARGRAIALIFLGWTVFGVLSANEWFLFIKVSEGRAAHWSVLLGLTLPGCWLWAAMTLFIVWLVQSYPMSRRTWRTRVWVYLAIGIAATFIDAALDFALQPLFSPRPRPSFWAAFISQFEFNLATFAVIVAFRHTVGYYRQARERQLRAAHLETQLARTQLQMLKMQLQPHFLFNALGAISELVHHDAERADRVVARLGDLLRMSMDTATRQEVPLRQELDFVDAYLAVQRARFDDRLVVEYDVEPATLDLLVPSLSLQPFVENAVIHGIAPRAGCGRVLVSATRCDGRLIVRIDDDGRGLPTDGRGVPREGLGITTTRARLTQLYGADFRIDLQNRVQGGVRVRIDLPLRDSAPHDGYGDRLARTAAR